MENGHKKVDPYVFPYEREDLTLRVRPTANAWWLDLSRVCLLLDAFDNHCSSVGEACFIAGITRRQYKYFAQIHPVIHERRRSAKFAKREREIEEKRFALGRKLLDEKPGSALKYLTFDSPEEFDLRYRSTYARLRRIHGLPAHRPPPRSKEQQLRDMAAEVEKTRIMLGHPSDPKHYAECSQCEYLLLPPSEWPEPQRSSYFQSMPQGQTPPGHTTAV